MSMVLGKQAQVPAWMPGVPAVAPVEYGLWPYCVANAAVGDDGQVSYPLQSPRQESSEPCIYICIYCDTHTYIYIHIYIFFYLFSCTYIYIHTYTYSCLYTSIYIYIHPDMYVYTCICKYYTTISPKDILIVALGT